MCAGNLPCFRGEALFCEERKRRNFPNLLVLPKHLPVKTSQVKTDTHHFLTNTHTQIPRELNLVTALPLRGWARPAPPKGSVTTRTTTTPSPYGATPPHPGAGRETHRKILPGVDGFSTTSRTSPTEKGGSMCREGGGKGSPGVITLMNPGPYWPLYLWGWLVGRGQRTAPCQGGVPATRWSPASLGTVR